MPEVRGRARRVGTGVSEREDWPLTYAAIDADAEADPYALDEPAELGNRLVRLMAQESGGQMREVAPGIWSDSTTPAAQPRLE